MKTNQTLNYEMYLKKYTNKRGTFCCEEVTIGWYGKERVDYLTYDTNNIFKCYEVKVTKSDFYSKCHNTFVGNYNYYVMPLDLYEQIKKDVPKEIGVLVENLDIKGNVDKHTPLKSIKKATKQKLKISKDILKNSLIRSLYREVKKIKK